MTPETARLGPYLLDQVLGEGACGTVYRARDSRSGRVTAVKAVRAQEGLSRIALRREMTALCLLNHPGVVRIHDQDPDSEPPYYAMELIEGESLADWASHKRAQSSGGADAYTCAVARCVASVCDALAYVHGEGLVHRDLQPRNIIIRKDGRPVLVDFGLVTRLPGPINREILANDFEGAGHVSYMAPELILGEFGDSRVDLYSLGCVAYELLTGHPPFVGSPRAILDGHLRGAPAAPGDLPARAPAPLVEIISRLISKDPSERPSYAEDVAALLRAWLGEGGAEVNPRSGCRFLHRARLVGRDRELGQLVTTIAAAASGRGGVAIVSGESGVGKTRILMEVEREARRRGFAVFAGTCPVTGARSLASAGVPLAPLREALRSVADHCREAGIADADRILGARGPVLLPFEPAMASVPGYDAYPAPEPLPPDATRTRILEALSDVWTALGVGGPVLLLLDDLQWGDDLTLAWLESIVRNDAFARSRVMVVGAARAEEIGVSLSDLLASPRVERHLLSPLGSAGVEALASDLLGRQDIKPEILVPLVTAAAGNPFFVTEYLQLAINETIISRSDSGAWQIDHAANSETLPLPRSVNELMQLRLGNLTPPARRLAETLAVCGKEASESMVLELAAMNDETAAIAVHDLALRRVLDAGIKPGMLRFAHDRLREALYMGLAEGRRQQLHEAAGRALEQRLVEDDGKANSSLVPEIALHFVSSGDTGRALGHLERAADAALANYSNREAAAFLSQAVASGAEGAVDVVRRARWLRKLGVAQNALGHIDASRESFTQALALFGHRFPDTALLRVVGIGREAVRVLGVFALQTLRKNEPRPEMSKGLRDEIEETLRSHEGLGYLLDDGLSVIFNCTRILRLAGRLAEGHILTRAFSTMGLAMGLLRWRGLAETLFKQSRRAAEGAPDADSQAWALLVEGYYRLAQGELQRATSTLEEGETLTRRSGERRRWEECLVLLTDAAILSGDMSKASNLCDDVLASARARGDRQTQLWALTNQARTLLQGGDPAAALTRLQKCGELLERTVPSDRILVEGLLSLALLRIGDEANAHAHAAETGRLIGDGRNAVYYTTYGCASAAEVLLTLARGTGPWSVQELLAAARPCLRSLRGHARLHPVGRPRYWLTMGMWWRATGSRRAVGAFARALAEATRVGLTFEGELARRALAA